MKFTENTNYYLIAINCRFKKQCIF